MSWQLFLTVFVAVFLAQVIAGIFGSGVSSDELDEKVEVLKVEIVSDIMDELRPRTNDFDD